jgi:hypothetical protein
VWKSENCCGADTTWRNVTDQPDINSIAIGDLHLDPNNPDVVYAGTGETTIRIDAMTVDLLDPAVPTNTMIGLEYFDVCKITNVQENGSTIVKTLQVQGLNWTITPNSMQVTVTTLENLTDGFVIGNSERGIIGISAMTY